MPHNLQLDDDRDPLAEDDEVIDAADDDEEFEDDEEEEDEEDVEDEGDIEARHALTAEVGGEGGSPGESIEIERRLGSQTRGSEASVTLHAPPARVVERRDEQGRRIKRAP